MRMWIRIVPKTELGVSTGKWVEVEISQRTDTNRFWAVEFAAANQIPEGYEMVDYSITNPELMELSL